MTGQHLPGKIALFGSGETAPAGRQVHEALFRELEAPIRVAVLETPAGFQPNSAWVAGRLAEFIEQRPSCRRATGMGPTAPTIAS
jgi:hypothetical protein